MPRFADILGQDRVIAHLVAAIARDRVHHAYLFTGATGAGKRQTSLAFAAALNCLQPTPSGDSCGACGACTRIADGIHPDVVTLAREGAAQIVPIESIRRDVITRVGLPPHEARVRVFIIDEANALQPAAANALLKTLEEPPARSMFVLGTIAPDQLLPTIRSRCQRVHFTPRPADLRAREAGEEAVAAKLAALADAVAAYASTGGRTHGEALTLAQRLAEDKGDVTAALELAAHRLHAKARAAAIAGDDVVAAALALRGKSLIDATVSLILHNANGQLAAEAALIAVAGAA